MTSKASHIQFLALWAMALLMAACADDPDGPVPMQFQACESDFTTSRAVGTTAINGDEYSLKLSSIFTPLGGEAEYYFTSIPLTYDKATKRFVAINYFFPLSGEMQLVAYGNSTGLSPEPSVTFTKTTTKKFKSLTADFTNASYDGRWELVYSDPLIVSCSSKMDPPVLQFHHTMTNLNFQFIPQDQASCSHIVINWIKVENVVTQGKFSYDYTTSKGTWSNKGTAADHLVNNLTTHTIDWATARTDPDGVGLKAGNGLFILPQDTRQRIIINYTMINDNAYPGGLDADGTTGTNRRTMNYVVNDPSPASAGWLASCRYIYRIRVRADYQMELVNVDVMAKEDGPTGTLEI